MEHNEAEVWYEKFLDSRLIREKREILQRIYREGLLTDKMIDDFAVTLDIVVPQASLDNRYFDLMRCLDSLAKFETTGLR
ncbi:MAG: hypothetical protein IKG67_08250 [Parasporobacterium sp.]|nr:hypothetical protein [Parasporobacterium sp.]